MQIRRTTKITQWGRGLNQKSKHFSYLRSMDMSKLVKIKCITKGVLGSFFDFLAKTSHFSAIWITFCSFLESFETAKIQKSVEKTKLSSHFRLLLSQQDKSKTNLNAFSLRLSALSALAKEGGWSPLLPVWLHHCPNTAHSSFALSYQLHSKNNSIYYTVSS